MTSFAALGRNCERLCRRACCWISSSLSSWSCTLIVLNCSWRDSSSALAVATRCLSSAVGSSFSSTRSIASFSSASASLTSLFRDSRVEVRRRRSLCRRVKRAASLCAALRPPATSAASCTALTSSERRILVATTVSHPSSSSNTVHSSSLVITGCR